jgi:hypothetical protein
VSEFGYEKQEYQYEVPSYKNFSDYSNLFNTVDDEDDYEDFDEEVVIDNEFTKIVEDVTGLLIQDKFYGTEVYLDEDDIFTLYEHLQKRYIQQY